MAEPIPKNANEFIEHQLDERLAVLEGLFQADALSFSGSLLFGADDVIRAVIEEMRQQRPDRTQLLVSLTTFGGYIEVVQRIVDTFRHHYEHVSFVIPNSAFSAGTVLAMSGDEIYMDYYSRLGPIDPQVETAGGKRVPALGYLIQWQRLLKKAVEGKLTMAEARLMIEGFDQAELYQIEQARELSVTLLEEWLVKYKFKNWKITESRKISPVTDRMRRQRAVSIGRLLNDTDRWHSHGYGISMAVLQRDLKLQINDLDADPAKCEATKRYHGLLSDYMTKRGNEGVLHTVGKYLPFM